MSDVSTDKLSFSYAVYCSLGEILTRLCFVE